MFSTTIRPFENLGEMAKASTLVVFAKVTRNYSEVEGGRTFYRSELMVNTSIKGGLQEGSLFSVQHMHTKYGELERIIWGDLKLEEGSSYLLFLEKMNNGFWQPKMLSYGAFQEVELNAEKYLLPFDLGAEVTIVKTSSGKKAKRLGVYFKAPLLNHLRQVSNGSNSWNEQSVVSKRQVSDFSHQRGTPPDGCTFLSDGASTPLPIARWEDIQSTGITIYTHEDGALNCTNTAMRVQDAVADLNSQYQGINLIYGGSHDFAPSASACAQSMNGGATGGEFTTWVDNNVGSNSIVIQYEDPCEEIADLSNCDGTLAVGGLYWFSSTHDAHGMTWSNAAYGNVVVNQGVGACQCGSDDFKVMITHEMTHALNIGHIETPIGVANMNPVCCSEITAVDIECLDFIYEPAGIIPVELSGFKGSIFNAHSKLEWTTESEVQNQGFEIQRSLDGKAWSKIGFVTGSANSSQKINYEFLDRSASEGLNYYRLKQIDYDARFEFSKIVSLRHSDRYGIDVYPNPTNDKVYIKGGGESPYQIIDHLGRILSKGLIHDFIDLSAYASGVYFIQIVTPNGKFVKRVVKL